MEYLTAQEFADKAGILKKTIENNTSRKSNKCPKKIKGVYLEKDCDEWIARRDKAIANSGKTGGKWRKQKVSTLSNVKVFNDILKVMAR